MSVKKMIIDTIRTNELSSFTLDDLRKLISSKEWTDSSASVEKGLYKNIWNLKKGGMLELVAAKNPKENRYVVTSLMHERYFQLTEENSTFVTIPGSTHYLESLKKRLNTYSSELATTSAEIQEYQEIIKAFPEQATQLNNNILASKERAFQLRGRLQAVENAIGSNVQ